MCIKHTLKNLGNVYIGTAEKYRKRVITFVFMIRRKIYGRLSAWKKESQGGLLTRTV